MKNKMKANLNEGFEILDRDKEFYHVACTVRIQEGKDKTRWTDSVFVQVFDKAGFENFKENKDKVGISADELIHIPMKEFEAVEKQRKEAEKAALKKQMEEEAEIARLKKEEEAKKKAELEKLKAELKAELKKEMKETKSNNKKQ